MRPNPCGIGAFSFGDSDQSDEGHAGVLFHSQELLNRLAPPAARRDDPDPPVEPALHPVLPPDRTRPPPTDAVDDLTTLLALANAPACAPIGCRTSTGYLSTRGATGARCC